MLHFNCRLFSRSIFQKKIIWVVKFLLRKRSDSIMQSWAEEKTKLIQTIKVKLPSLKFVQRLPKNATRHTHAKFGEKRKFSGQNEVKNLFLEYFKTQFHYESISYFWLIFTRILSKNRKCEIVNYAIFVFYYCDTLITLWKLCRFPNFACN